MAQTFYINKGSILPVLRMELIDDGRYDYKRNHIINTALSNAEITFSMKSMENDRYVIRNAKADVVFSSEDSCVDKALLQYKWKEKDVAKEGRYKANFTIRFTDEIYEDGVDFPSGTLIVPIMDELEIIIK